MKSLGSELKALIHTEVFNFFTSTLIALFYTYFLINHFIALRNGEISATVIIFMVMETVVIALLFLRKQPITRSTQLLAWVFAFLGTFLPLLLEPSNITPNQKLGDIFVVIGGSLAVLSYLSLNNSFGIAPAIREIKTSGLYKTIRHPMYLSYFFIYIGYNFISFSIFNLSITTLLFIFLVCRIYYEEKILNEDGSYQVYKKQVKYKLIPGIF